MSEDTHTDEIEVERRSVLAATAGGLALGAFGSGATGVAGADGHDGETVTIIHDTHFHGRFQDSGVSTKDIVAYDAVINQWREEYDRTLFFGNGDDLAPSVLGLEFEGAHMIEALNLMEPDAVGPGNHEFDFGVETATDRFEESEFPWVVANLLTPEGEALPGTERWTTVDVGDVTVGVFGLVVNGFYSLTDYPEEYEVIDNVEAAREATAALREDGADLVVCPAHVSSGRMEDIAEEVDDLDAIIGSHSGVIDEGPTVVGGTLVSEFGDEFGHLARLEIDPESGELADWERVDFFDAEEEEEDSLPAIADEERRTVVEVNDLDGDAELRELTDGYLADLDERLGEPVVESEVELNASFDNYAIETGWGNLMLDVMRDIGDFDGGVDVATQNAGGIRSGATYGPGELTKRDVNNILPFPNEIEVYELEGEYLYQYLENQVRPMPGDFGAQPAIQVSGVSYEWTGHDGEAEINNVLIGGEPIDTDETYLVSTNDYEAGRTVISEEGELVLQSGQFQGAFVMDRLEEDYETVAPEREHRMIRVDERVETVDIAHEEETLLVTVEQTDAMEEPVEDSFRLLAPSGDTAGATAVEAADGAITATFDAAAVEALVAEDAPEPPLRLLGGFEPDDEYYGYENDDDETIDLPVSSGYDYHKLQAEPDASAVLELLQEDDGDGSDGGDDGDGSDGGDDGSGGDGETDDGSESEDADDDGPGFGPFAAIAGTGGAAYLLSQRSGSEETDDSE